MLRRVSRDLGQRCLVNHNPRHHTALPGNRWATSPKLIQCSQGTDKTTSEFRRNSPAGPQKTMGKRTVIRPILSEKSTALLWWWRVATTPAHRVWSSSIKSLDLCRRFKHSKIFKAFLSFTAQLKHDFLHRNPDLGSPQHRCLFPGSPQPLWSWADHRAPAPPASVERWCWRPDGILGMETCQRTEIYIYK